MRFWLAFLMIPLLIPGFFAVIIDSDDIEDLEKLE